MYVYGDYLYVATFTVGTTGTNPTPGSNAIQKYNKTTLALVAETPALEYAFATAMISDGTYLYALMVNLGTDEHTVGVLSGVCKYLLSDMSLTTIKIYSNISLIYLCKRFVYLSGFLYIGGWIEEGSVNNVMHVYKVSVTNFTVSASLEITGVVADSNDPIFVVTDDTSLYVSVNDQKTPWTHSLAKVKISDMSLTARTYTTTTDYTNDLIYYTYDSVGYLFDARYGAVARSVASTMAVDITKTSALLLIYPYPVMHFDESSLSGTGDININVYYNKNITLDRSYFATQGTSLTVQVTVDDDVADVGYDAYLDFLLPDGTSYWRGGFDCGNGSFIFTLASDDIIISKDGDLLIQLVLADETDGVRTTYWSSFQIESYIQSS
jgi:hypothetical protein